MEKKKAFQSFTLLDETAQLKIYGGDSPIEGGIKIYIAKGCAFWGNCKKICNVMNPNPQIPGTEIK